MSGPEGFLARWSRRKRETEPEAEPKPASPAGAEEHVQETEVAPGDESPAAAEGAPAFDVSTLPTIESITADTDIRAFLAPGVPAQLTQAALRHAWTADPAIRDFIGLSENAWDFNAGAVPGFGTLNPQEVARLVQHLAAGFTEPPDKNPEPASDNPVTSSLSLSKTQHIPSEAASSEGLCIREDGALGHQAEVAAIQSVEPFEASDVAPQNDGSSKSPARAKQTRRHGGALPE